MKRTVFGNFGVTYCLHLQEKIVNIKRNLQEASYKQRRHDVTPQMLMLFKDYII
jgi:hypothetical protein